MGKLKPGFEFMDAAGNKCVVRENGTINVITLNEEPSLTIQSEKDACDINKIVERFQSTGVMTNVAKAMPKSDDFSEVTDYHSAMNQIVAAQEAFMALPATVRKRFDNDPGNLLAFLEDPQNRSEAVSLGLVDASQDQNIPQEVSPVGGSEQSLT